MSRQYKNSSFYSGPQYFHQKTTPYVYALQLARVERGVADGAAKVALDTAKEALVVYILFSLVPRPYFDIKVSWTKNILSR